MKALRELEVELHAFCLYWTNWSGWFYVPTSLRQSKAPPGGKAGDEGKNLTLLEKLTPIFNL
jgi:hypothetical protein